jgi:hypothetical protein
VEVTQVQEAAVVAEATRIAAVLAIETFAQEADVVQDSTALRIKDAEDQAALSETIALLEGELVVEHRAREVSKRERREQFEELTLLQARGSELCHAIVSPRQARHDLFEGMRLAALCHTEMAGELAALGAAVSSTVESALFQQHLPRGGCG